MFIPVQFFGGEQSASPIITPHRASGVRIPATTSSK